MKKIATTLVLLSLLLLLPFSAMADDPIPAIPWPTDAPDIDYVTNVYTTAVANEATYGRITNLASWGNYILVSHQRALVILDKTSNNVLKTWLMSDMVAEYTGSDQELRAVWQQGFTLTGAVVDNNFIYLSIESYYGEESKFDRTWFTYNFINTFQNTLNSDRSVKRIYDAFVQSYSADNNLPQNKYYLTPLKMYLRNGKILFCGYNETYLGYGVFGPLAIVTPATQSGTAGDAQYSVGQEKWLDATHFTNALTKAGYSELNTGMRGFTGVIRNNYLYLSMEVQYAGPTTKGYVFVVDISETDDFNPATAIVAVKDMELPAEFTNYFGITDACVSGDYLYYGLWSGNADQPKPNVIIFNISDATNPGLVDSGIWTKAAPADANGRVSVSTINVFGPIVVTTLEYTNNIVKTLLNENKTQQVQELYAPYLQQRTALSWEYDGKYIYANPGKWSDEDKFTTRVSLPIGNDLYLVSGQYKIIKMTYDSKSSIPESTVVSNMRFSKTAITQGQITATLDYTIGLDTKGVTMAIGKFEKVNNKLRFKSVKFTETEGVLNPEDEGSLSLGIDITEQEANAGNIMLKIFAFSDRGNITPYGLNSLELGR